MSDSYLNFDLADSERFSKLEAIFAVLKSAKETESDYSAFPDPESDYWLGFFDDASLKYYLQLRATLYRFANGKHFAQAE